MLPSDWQSIIFNMMLLELFVREMSGDGMPDNVQAAPSIRSLSQISLICNKLVLVD